MGLDYWAFAPHVDVISWDSYPRWHSEADDLQVASSTAFFHDLHRAYKQQPFLLMESTPSVTNWQGISRLKRPGLHQLSSLQAVAHGANGVQYFQWRQSRGGTEKFHGAVVSHGGLVTALGLETAVNQPLPRGVTAQVRLADREKFIFLLNFEPLSQTFKLDVPEAVDAVSGQAVGGEIRLAGYGFLVLRQGRGS